MIMADKLIAAIQRHCVRWGEYGSFTDLDMAKHYAASIYGDVEGVQVKQTQAGVFSVIAWKRGH